MLVGSDAFNNLTECNLIKEQHRATWNSVELLGATRSCLGLPGVAWGCLELPGAAWSSVEQQTLAHSSIDQSTATQCAMINLYSENKFVKKFQNF